MNLPPTPRSPLCGRHEERARLAKAVSRQSGHIRGAVVTGQSGLGKTRLLEAATHDASTHGAIVLRGSCLDLGDSWPLHPLREAAPQLRAKFGSIPAAARLIETLEGRVAADAKADIVAAAHVELTKLSRAHRLVLAIDDLQWVDSSTIRLIRTLLSGLTPNSISLLGGLRTDANDPSSYSPLLVEFHSSPSVDVFELDPLDKKSTLDLARSISQQPLSAEKATKLWKRSGGVPLLTKALAVQDERGLDSLKSIRVVLASRIDRLPSATKNLVRVASLGIGAIDHEVARSVLGLDDNELVAAARQAVAEGILTSVGVRYSPVHDFFREIAQESLLEPEKKLWHKRIAKAIESDLRTGDPDPIELAHHWAGAGDPERALPSFIQAAREATGQGAFIEAWHHWQDVTDILATLSSFPDLPALLAEAAEAAHRADVHDASLAIISRAEAIESDIHRTTALTLDRSRYLAASGHLEEAETLCAEIFEADDTVTDVAIRAGAQSADLLTRLGRYEAAVDQATRILERSQDESVDEAALLLATSALACSKAYLGFPDLARKQLSGALHQATLHGDHDLIEAASRHYTDLLLGPLNELEAGVQLAQQQARYLIDHGAGGRHATFLLATATTGLFRLGRWPEARTAATEALESDPTGAGVIDLLLGRVRTVMSLGDLDASEHDLRTASNLLGANPNPRHELPYWTLEACQSIWRDDIEQARSHIGRAFARVDINNVDDPWLWAPTIWHGLRAEALSKTPDIDQSVHLFSAMTRIRDDTVVDNTQQGNHLEGYFLLCAGELDVVLGISRPSVWKKATEVWDGCGHPYPAAYARMLQAKTMFGERTRNREAEVVLGEAYRISRDLGAKLLMEEITGLAQRARIQLEHDIDLTSPDSAPNEKPKSRLADLTAREQEIIVEVAEGRSNREIGERLFISGRTVGVHVSNILTKLHVKTRVEAASVYIRESTESTESADEQSGGNPRRS